MSSSAFVDGARMLGILSVLATQNVANTSASNTDFSHLPMRYSVNDN